MIPFSKPVYYGNEVSYAKDAVESTWISHGYYVDKFESMLKEILNVNHVLTTSNGTTAIMLAYLILGLQPEDEVIIPGYCFQAAANVALQMGIKPIFADIFAGSLNVNIDDIVRKITDKTKAIVIVNNYGNISDIKLLRKLTNIPIIEDCAESIFSRINYDFCGTIADIGTFSFHATKTITTGEGGAVVINNPLLAEKAKLLINHGLQVRGTYNHVLPGNNFRMTNMQAAIGVAQLENFSEIIEKKLEIFSLYEKLFKTPELLLGQFYRSEVIPTIWSYVIILNPKFRDKTYKIIDDLKSNFKIETRPGFIPPNLLPYFTSIEKNDIPFSNMVYNRIIVLPSYTDLLEEEIRYIVNSTFRTVNAWK